MTKKSISLQLLFIFAALTLSTSVAFAEIVVIGNIHNNVPLMTKKQVQEIFLGRTRTFSNGIRALPLDVVGLRSKFYKKLTNRPIEQINAYWARLKFSGRSSPPHLKPDQQSAISAVSSGKGVIAYIDRDQLDETQVKVLFIVK